MTRVLLVGSGGREHAIAEALSRSDGCKLYAFMGSKNPGIMRISEESTVGDTNEVAAVVKWAKARKIEAAVIGPEGPLSKGLADELAKAEILVCGPSKNAARIEWDKAYARELMQKSRISGCPKFRATGDAKEAAQFIDEMNGNVAVKPSGLTAGKGVKVTGFQLKDGAEAKKYAAEVLSTKIGGMASVVLEEKLEGEEFTFQVFADGSSIHPMPLVQDNKLAFEGDKGPNTGGMGSYSHEDHLLPFLDAGDRDEALEIMKATIGALARAGSPYRGILYGGFIATEKGVKVIEFNARFGDPEAMNVLSLLEGDFAEIAARIGEGQLARDEMAFARRATVCKYIVPEGYPDAPVKGAVLDVNQEEVGREGCTLYYASVESSAKDEDEGKLVTLGSRALAIVGEGENIEEAEKRAERSCAYVKRKVFHRRDIGTEQLIRKRVEHMDWLRRSIRKSG